MKAYVVSKETLEIVEVISHVVSVEFYGRGCRVNYVDTDGSFITTAFNAHGEYVVSIYEEVCK